MRILRTIQLAIKSLLLHKLRSALTMLGIVFGVFSVIAMLAIGEGASRKAQDQVLELGAKNIIVKSVKPSQQKSTTNSGGGSMMRYGLLRDDLKLISPGQIPHVTNAIPIREVKQQLRNGRHDMEGNLVGCSPEYQETNNLKMSRGRFLSHHDLIQMQPVCVIAAEIAETLFPGQDPLNRSFQVGTDFYEVIGIAEPRKATASIGGSLAGREYNKDVYVPLRTMQVRLGDDNIQRGQGSFSAESVQLHQITVQIDDENYVLSTAEVIKESLQRNHKDDSDWDIVVPMELLDQAKQIQVIFNLVLGSIAAISLVVGGIGIMNIMLATVTERTREIGVRRALGARQRDITEQFLTETVVLAGIGGCIGVILGMLTPVAFDGIQWMIDFFSPSTGNSDQAFENLFTGLVPIVKPWTLGLAFGISVGIGIVFGVYPARAAARLDPIEALRHE